MSLRQASPPLTSQEHRLLDAEATAVYLGVTPAAVRQWASERRLTHVKLGRLLRFRVEDLEAFIVAGRVEARPESTGRPSHKDPTSFLGTDRRQSSRIDSRTSSELRSLWKKQMPR
jgi:excisionase family DNA binding protein